MANGALLDYLRKPATKKDLKIKDQIDMAAQCADGMAYLETTVSLASCFTVFEVNMEYRCPK